MLAVAEPPSAASIADARARYLANLAALFARDPELAARVDALPFTQLPTIQRARDGRATLNLPADDGPLIAVHSRYEPAVEARRFVDALPEAENHTFLIAGMGLGYILPELERRFEQPFLIVVEDDLSLLKAALCAIDLEPQLRAGRLVFIASADRAEIHAKLTSCNADVMLGMQFVQTPYARRRHAAFQERARSAILDYVSYGRLQMVTLLRNARVTFRNVAMNAPHYARHVGIEALRGKAAGYPAILVAAGPSLARNVAQLGALRERAVIIGVQTVYKLLLALDCPPHFVTSLDYHEISAEFFEGLRDARGTRLVAEPKATHRVLDLFPGAMHVLHHLFYDALFGPAAPQRGGLKAGSTVAHLALYLAEHLGCDPIIMIGQDLCYAEGLYYPPGMPIEQIWRPELGRFCTVEMKQWERIARNRQILRRVEDQQSRATYTDDQLFTYAEQFQSDFPSLRARVIQASEGGLRLDGAGVMTLREAAERYCTRRLPPDIIALPQPFEAQSLAALRDALVSRLEEIRQTRDIAERVSELLARLEGLLDRPQEFNRLVGRVDELRLQMQRFEHVYRLVVEVSQLAELRRYQADRRMGDPQHETVETARRRLRRDREFVADFLDGCEFLEDTLPEALRRLEDDAG
ncbi:MAG: 6-hydroxymethylpterin diphosphokinase MptE-like protein [Phycisphaerae bacterium]